MNLTAAEVEAARVTLLQRVGVLDFVPAISPTFAKPTHQRPLASLIRRAHRAQRGDGPPVFACVSEAPQVGKTETVMHGIAWWLRRNPEDYLAYLTYGQDLADKKSRRMRDYAKAAGIKLRDDASGVQEWHTAENGGLLARGWGGGITGQDALSTIFADDLYKNRAQAESSAHRDKVDEEFRSTFMTRLGPRSSCIVFATRWHEDDQTGRLIKRGWEYHNLPAISPEGAPFWAESGRDLEYYARIREQVGEYAWWSLYMGEPRPREGKLFLGTYLYRERPPVGRFAIGVDLAYSSKTTADYSVAVVMMRTDYRCYVVDVIRRQCSAPQFAATLRVLQNKWRGAPIGWYAGGTEKGVADFLRTEGVHVRTMKIEGDKFIRAQATSAAWKRGEIMLPGEDVEATDPEWLDDFVGEVTDFSGKGDRHDDQVDALVAAYDMLSAGTGGPIYVPPSTPVLTPWGTTGLGSVDDARRHKKPWE